jgi:hypothetical protein
MALFITLGLISRPSTKMLSLAQHLSVYAVSCTVVGRYKKRVFLEEKSFHYTN